MRGSNASQKISVAKRDRRRFRLENENVGEKMSSCERSRKSSSSAAVGGCRKQSTTARRYDVGLTSKWFEAALLDVNGSPDLPDIRMNVTECHCGFLHLHCQHCGASTCISKAWCCEGVVFQVSPTLIETAAP